MSRFRLGVAAAIILAIAVPAASVQAQKAAQKKEKPAAIGPTAPITEKDRARGKAEAPALAKAGGLACTIADARFILQDIKTKTNYFEVACDQGLGYVVIADPAKPAPTLAPCLEASKPGADGKLSPLTCRLDTNVDQQALLAPYVAKAGKACTISKSRYIGSSPAKSFIELACSEGSGYVLEVTNPANMSGEIRMNNCLNYEPGQTISCELSDRNAQLAVVDTLVAGSGKACAVKDKRFVLTAQNGANWFEAACQDGSGYMVEQAANGSLARTVACADADFVGGGCTLTDSRAAKTESNGIYSRLSTKAGFQCDVEQYGTFSAPTKGADVVELKCKNRPDGGIGVFTATSNVVYNCALAEAQGFRCSFTKKDLAYAQITKDLKSKKETTCVVGNTRNMDRATDSTVFLEAGCTDGAGSYVLGYQKGTNTVTEVLACSQAKDLGGCKLGK